MADLGPHSATRTSPVGEQNRGGVGNATQFRGSILILDRPAVICGYLRFRPQCLNDSTIGTRRSALDYSTSLFRLPQVTVAFHDHGPSPSVAFHSLPQPNPVPSPTVTYGRLPTATEAKIAFFQKLRFRSPEQNGPKRTKTELIPSHKK